MIETRTRRNWRVLAIRYGTAKLSSHHLGLDVDPHESGGSLDYFIWVISDGREHIVVDTGFDPAEGARRGRQLIQHPANGLKELGIDAAAISDVVVTHLHYDHAGNLAAFPAAQFHLQDAEMAYATGRCMCHPRMSLPFAVEHVTHAVRLVYERRVDFHDGDYELAPGVTVWKIGGHSRGLQVVRVETESRVIVIASDALHLARYLDSEDVFPLFADYQNVVEGYRKLRDLAGPGGLILPGHDPGLITQFAPVRPDRANILDIR